MNQQEYIEKWLSGTLTDEEKLIFEKMEEYPSLLRLSNAVKLFKAPEYDVQAEFQHLEARKLAAGKTTVVRLNWLMPLLKVAAVLSVILGGYLLFLSNPATTSETLASGKAEIFLPDSSAVVLNALSTLTYHARGWDDHRQVALEGEAFFRVAKGSRFDVKTEAGIVSVLGTQFNVKVRNNYFEVTCYEGLVEVTTKQTVVTLASGKMIRIINGVVTPNSDTGEPSPAWLDNESSFESVPVSSVLEEFERQYNVTITTRNVNVDQLFSGRFTHSDITLALKSISIPLDLEFEVDADQKTVVLYRAVQ